MGQFITAEAARERISAALGAIDDAHAVLRGTPSDEVGTAFRVKIAERILPRRSVLGEPLQPRLAEVAKAVMAGRIGEDHLKVITTAIDKLPSCVSVTDRTDVEASLVREAVKSDADIVRAAANL